MTLECSMQEARIELLQRMPVFGESGQTSSNFCWSVSDCVGPDQ